MSNPQPSPKMKFGPAPSIVLVNPQLGENIGMAARAMANFSLSDLRLVSPREGIEMERAVTASAGAVEIVEAASVHDQLENAIAEFHYVYATQRGPVI